MISTLEKNCLECGSPVHGRADKKFCSDPCRSAYNNNLEVESRQYIRQVHYILRKNRRILSELKARGQKKVSSEKLRVQGFDFNYFTSHYRDEDGSNYCYCYDLGFCLRTKEENVLIVEKKW